MTSLHRLKQGLPANDFMRPLSSPLKCSPETPLNNTVEVHSTLLWKLISIGSLTAHLEPAAPNPCTIYKTCSILQEAANGSVANDGPATSAVPRASRLHQCSMTGLQHLRKMKATHKELACRAPTMSSLRPGNSSTRHAFPSAETSLRP
ncbi:hypothetical protein NDU88_007510, partial [Pleurodeles waltl]